MEIDLGRIERTPNTLAPGGKLNAIEMVNIFLGKIGVAVSEDLYQELLGDMSNLVKEGSGMRIFQPLGPKLIPIAKALSHTHKQN